MREHDIVVIGGGPAGLAAAIGACEGGARDVLILERDDCLGGILNQCIHNGFGLHTFREELTGPEYAERFIRRAGELNIPHLCGVTVLSVSPDRVISAVSGSRGFFQLRAGAVILAMGCRERPRGALGIPGFRPAGIYSAGTAQRLMNLEGFLPGRRVVILGSGDIGLIMARRLSLEGARVELVAELMPYSSGLKRNIAQCLDDYGIPLKLSHTVVDILGRQRVEGVVTARVDARREPIPGTEETWPCDTLLLSVGLIPENELSAGLGLAMDPGTRGPVVNERMQTSLPGVFACGNVLHVHDLVDYVSEEAGLAGRRAAEYVSAPEAADGPDRAVLTPGEGVGYTVPGCVSPDPDRPVTVRFRVTRAARNCAEVLLFDGEEVLRRRRPIVTPGEMEQLRLTPELFVRHPRPKRITLRLEGGEGA